MRIGINLLYLIPLVVGGTETYASGLLDALARTDHDDEFVVFVNQESANWELPAASNFSRVVCPVWAANRVQRYFFEQVHLPSLLKKYQVQLVHSLGYVAPLFPSCPSVVTIHDLNFRAFGGHMTPARQWALEFFVRQSARRARHVIAVSEHTRRQIISLLGISPAKVTVTLEAATAMKSLPETGADTMKRHKIAKRYIVAFSSLSSNKNIPRLVRAFSLARHEYGLPHQLVVIGNDPGSRPSDISDAVVFTGYLDEAAKQRILAGAELLVFPSTYEGFGLPVLEAQQSGVPVVCSAAASLPEVAGEAAVFFDPMSVDEMARAIGRVAKDPALQATLRTMGYHNIGRFSWEKAARETLAVYENALASA